MDMKKDIFWNRFDGVRTPLPESQIWVVVGYETLPVLRSVVCTAWEFNTHGISLEVYATYNSKAYKH